MNNRVVKLKNPTGKLAICTPNTGHPVLGVHINAAPVLCLIPFLRQEEIADISVFDPVSAHIELIERNNVLREVVADSSHTHQTHG